MRSAVALVIALTAGQAVAQEKLALTVKETAGIRRFGYPVAVTLKLPRPATEKDGFRLVADGKPVAAQFHVLDDPKAVAVDFTAGPGPFESLLYAVEYGPSVAQGKEKAGMTLDETKERLAVSSGGMKYVVPATLRGCWRR
jgi:hypothetical protein